MYLQIEDDRNIKILVVEDESIIALDLTRRLKDLGFTPLKPVDTGKKAIAAVNKNKPDLIILDIKIKGEIDGIETASIIRGIHSVPYIFISAFNDPGTLKRIRQVEPYGYIPKSSNNIDLYTTVKIALQRFSIEKAYHSNEELLSTIMKSITDAVIGVNEAGEIIFWNNGAEKIFGWDEPEVQGMDVSILIPSYIPNEFPDIIEETIKEGKEKIFDTVFKDKFGKIISVLTTLSPAYSLTGEFNGFSLVIKDITEQKKLEKQIIDILEEERFRIGQELHDNLGQYLTGILLKLKVLENGLSRKHLGEEKELVIRIASHVKESLKKAREISRGLVTLGLENLTLLDALEELTSYFANIQNIRVTFTSFIDEEITEHSIIAQLYHIAQEAITNALKHSGGTNVKIILSCNETEVIMKVEDNGKGMDMKKTDGLGLKIMKYRADMIQGRLYVYSSSDKGTAVYCSIPKAVLRR